MASPEHWDAATGHEIHAWRSITQEQALVHDAPVSGGSGFVDLRGRPAPPAASAEEPAEQGDESGMDVGPQAEAPEGQQPAPAPPEPEAPRAAPAAPEPPAASAPAVEAEDVPVPPDPELDAEFDMEKEFDAAMQDIMRDDGEGWHPDTHGVHSEPEPGASRHRRPGGLPEEEEAQERREREAKRRRLLDDVPISIRQGAAGSSQQAPPDSAAFVLDNDLEEFSVAGRETYQQDEAFFTREGVSSEEFLFGLRRNDFEHAFLTKKPGRKEIKLGSLPEEQRRKFLDRGGSRDEEWRSWQDFDAAEPVPPDESERLRSNKANIIIPMRCVDTDKNDGKYDEAGAPLPLLAKSRLVVVGFRDRLLGMFRRDAPTASRLAEALLLTLTAAMGMILAPGRRQECLLQWAGLAARGLPGAAPRGPAGPRPRPAAEGTQGHLWLRGGRAALLASAAGRHAGRRVVPVAPGAGSLLQARGRGAEGHRGLARRRHAVGEDEGYAAEGPPAEGHEYVPVEVERAALYLPWPGALE